MPGEYVPGQDAFEPFEGSHETVPQDGATDAGQGDVQRPENIPDEVWDAYANRRDWERAYKQKDQRFAQARKVLETAFGRGMNEWNAVDMTDLQAFSMLNSRIRSDPEFAKKWHGALTATFQESGATKAEASAKATDVIAGQKAAAEQTTQQPKAPEIPKEFQDRMARLEQMATQNQMNALEGTLWGELDSQITTLASDLKEEFGDLIEEQALQGLFFHPDQELMARAQDGTLPQLVGAYVKRASDRLRQKNTAFLQRRATAKKSAPPTPFGAAAGATPSKSRDQMSLKEMHEDFLRSMKTEE